MQVRCAFYTCMLITPLILTAPVHLTDGFVVPHDELGAVCRHSMHMRGTTVTTARTPWYSRTMMPMFTTDDAVVLGSCEAFGGDLVAIGIEREDDGFLTKLAVPTFAAYPNESAQVRNNSGINEQRVTPTRLGLEALVPGAFLLKDALQIEACESMIHTCEKELGFGNYRSGKNNHGAMQIIVTDEAANQISRVLSRHVDLNSLRSLPMPPPMNRSDSPDENPGDNLRYTIAGINRRWRIYRYEAGGKETFAPHIDAGFPPSGLSKDGKKLVWDASSKYDATGGVVSRFTVLMYLNDDFVGGETNFFAPLSEQAQLQDVFPCVLASVKPRAGSILVFPQAVGEEAVEFARQHWPLHEGSVVPSGIRPKYVVRSDILITTSKGMTREEMVDPMFQFDNVVRQTFMTKSPALDRIFLNHLSSLYNPHMGVENAGPLLYSFVRFTKIRLVVEIGSGYTSLWLMQALKDNDDEMNRIDTLIKQGKCRLLDYPWAILEKVNEYEKNKSKLLCIDNCLHQRQTATGTAAVARALGLDSYFEFKQGDAFEIPLEPESIDLLWCDFGVGSRMWEFAPNAWKSIRPGGYLICHSTLTNSGTRDWLEDARRGKEEAFGVSADEFVELSLLEPHKRYQNSVSIFQRRSGHSGPFIEPIYSKYA